MGVEENKKVDELEMGEREVMQDEDRNREITSRRAYLLLSLRIIKVIDVDGDDEYFPFHP